MDDAYRSQLVERLRRVLDRNPELEDHLERHPWLIGALGDPGAGVWFVAQSPTLEGAEHATDPGGGPPTEEAQWWSGPGERLFREILHAHGLKSTPPEEPGGWRCYLTTVVKQPDYDRHWTGRSMRQRERAAERWAPVLAWELSVSRPALVVTLGRIVPRLLEHLDGRWVHLPRVMTVDSYVYIAGVPEGKLGPMHPERVARYRAEIGRVAEHARLLRLMEYGFGDDPREFDFDPDA